MKIELDIPCLPDFQNPVRELVQKVFKAHQVCALRNNNSTVAAANARIGSGKLANGLASAILTIGGPHGPIGLARAVFDGIPLDTIPKMIEKGMAIAGFGSDFVKGKPDDAWADVDAFLKEAFHDQHARLVELTDAIHSCGKGVYPNAAIYTAIACGLAEVPKGSEDLFFILPRIPIWTQVCLI